MIAFKCWTSCDSTQCEGYISRKNIYESFIFLSIFRFFFSIFSIFLFQYKIADSVKCGLGGNSVKHPGSDEFLLCFRMTDTGVYNTDGNENLMVTHTLMLGDECDNLFIDRLNREEY